MLKENQLVSGQLGQAAQHADTSREELRRLQTSHGVLQQTVKARELELEDLRTAYEELAGESRQYQSGVGQMQRQLQGARVELEAAKQEVTHLQVCAADAVACCCVVTIQLKSDAQPARSTANQSLSAIAEALSSAAYQ